MKISCKRCNPDEVFEVPNFSLEEKRKLSNLHARSPLLAVKELKDLNNVLLKDAKFVIAHLNKEKTICHRCNTQLDTQEYVSCPKCNALNFNWNLDF